MRRVHGGFVALLWIAVLGAALAAVDLRLPGRPDSVKFAAIGDSGTGEAPQYEVGRVLAGYHARFPFDLVVMLGDNIYGAERPQDFVKKFEQPYQPLLSAGVAFRAALGNHDSPNQRSYRLFNMNGARYYTYSKGAAQFFALDSGFLDPKQLVWLEQELRASRAAWKVAYFHHPLYSSGRRHGSSVELRVRLEPLFVAYGVNLVLAGHEHVYERINPQKGIYYFTCGASAKLRKGNIRRGPLTASGFDTDNTFLLFEIDGDALHFQAVSRADAVVDAGTLPRQPAARSRE